MHVLNVWQPKTTEILKKYTGFKINEIKIAPAYDLTVNEMLTSFILITHVVLPWVCYITLINGIIILLTMGLTLGYQGIRENLMELIFRMKLNATLKLPW